MTHAGSGHSGCVAAPVVASSALRKPLETPAGVSSDAETILVADDDADMRRLIGAVLKSKAYRVLFAEDGRKAAEVAQREEPDLILLDCQMPELDGIDVCTLLRQDARFDDVPIFFLTGLASSDDKARGFAAGGADYLTKPIDRAELVARIRVHLDLARAHRQLRRQSVLLEGVVGDQAGRLNQVRDGQASILAVPSDFPQVHTAVRFEPILEAGGDYYDIVRLSDSQFGFIVADVSGHDLGVAYLTGAMKALTASFTSEALTVVETMFMLNGGLRKFLPSGQYVTACYAKLDKSTSTLDLTCAGHPAPLLQRSSGGIEVCDLVGDILGMHETVSCESASLPVSPGDRLFLYTDGITESYPDSTGKLGGRDWGMVCLQESIRRKAGIELQEVVDGVVDELLDRNNGSVSDDVLLLGVEFQRVR